MTARILAITFAVIALVTLGACGQKGPDPSAKKASAADEAKKAAAAPALPAAAPAPQPNPERNAYFGETHIHTSWSVDAWIIGNRLTGPGDALKYAQGQTIKHPMGYDIRIDTPMDFMGVTDHSEYVGITREANTPGSFVSKLPEAQPLIMKDPNSAQEQQKVFLYLLSLANRPPIKAFMSPKVAGSIWKDNIRIANENNHPGKFTAFCSYEYTSQFNNRNLHRNIFFRDCARVPELPYSMLDSWHPEDLWKWMDTQRKAGNELLAISHNANLSDGWMYPVDLDSNGRPIDAAWAAARDRNERLIEIKQIKGASETHPLLSPNDEFAGYEIFSGLLGLPPDNGRIDHITGSFARQALKDGIAMQDVRGYNPYKFGFGAASDSHNTGSPYRQDNFFGGHGEIDGTVERRMAGVMLGKTIDSRLENPAGLTGVWAEENTRASLWDAMYRKETFGVSGPHIKVRFFGGWAYGKDLMNASDWVKQSYAGGVPMGADLPPMPSGGKGTAPTFVVWAVKDPASGNLDRVQVIKGWTKNGQSFEKIHDVAWSGDRKPDKWSGRVPAIQSTVDLEKATYTNSVGAAELKAVWRDPEFDASLHAFYYVRVLEIPTPRWTLFQAVKAGLPPPDVVPLTGQERAWTSPIWYTPSAEARKNARAGMTVAELKKKVAAPLNNAQLKALISGKAFWVQNNVTGEQFSQSFTAEGHMTTFHIGTNAVVPSGYGNVVRDGYEGATVPYRIEGGKLVTFISQDPYSVTVYKLGNTYFGARSNEFGYANYEMIPTPQIVVNPLTELTSQFSIELGLTEQQKQQIIPILSDDLKQLEPVKKDTSLSALKKVERLRQIGSSFAEKVKPLLNPDQQAKFETLRERVRRRLIEKMASEIVEKVEGAAKKDLETIKEELTRAWFGASHGAASR
jgi:predicted small lipoprotein YifL